MVNTMAKNTKKPNAQVAEKVARKSTAAKKSNLGGIVLSIIVMATLAGGGYVWQQLERSNATWLAEQAELGKRIDQLEQRLNERLDDVEKNFTDSVSALRSELGGDVDHRNLQEIERLLEIANQRLQLSADVDLARNALQLADDRLRRLSHSAYASALAPVREMITNEIALLDNAATVDVVGTLNALSALASSVNELPLAGDTHVMDGGDTHEDAHEDAHEDTNDDAHEDASDDAHEDASDDSWLWEAGKNFLADLGALVQIDTDDQSPPTRSTERRVMMIEKTGLIIDSAQLAFVREQKEVYELRMSAAKNWVTANFNTDSAQVGAWLERWATVAAVSPRAELPDISNSLRALRGVMDAQ